MPIWNVQSQIPVGQIDAGSRASVLRFSFAKGKLLLRLLGTPYLVERNLPGKMKFGLQYAYKLASLQQDEVIYAFLWDSLQK